MSLERTAPMLMLAGHVQRTTLQRRILQGRFLQLQHQMFALHQKVSELFPILFLVQLLDVVELHCRVSLTGAALLTGCSLCVACNMDWATASAILMPSTPADRMPPA